MPVALDRPATAEAAEPGFRDHGGEPMVAPPPAAPDAPGSDVIGFYDQRATRFAGRYDGSRAFRQRNEIWSQWIADFVKPTDAVLDVGCGSGIFSRVAAAHARIVHGCDGSAAMIALSRQEAAAAGVSNTEFRQLRIENLLDGLTGPYDTVLCSSVLEYLEKPVETIAAVASLMRPGGTFLFSLPNSRSHYRRLEAMTHRLTGQPKYFGLVRWVPSEAEVASVLAAHGLSIVRSAQFGDPPIRSIMRLFPGGAGALKTMILFAAQKAGS